LAPFIENAKAGFVVGSDTDTLTEAVAQLIEDKFLRQETGRNAAALAKREFSMSRISKTIVETYARVVAKHG
jgi:glycosyltransferase involved in cell wall biosynthesis